MNKIMRTKIVCLFLCIIILCSSCDSYFKKLDGIDFSVGWINMPELTNLYYDYPDGGSCGVTEGRITDVYWNEQYILAKQCKMYNDSIKGYYIVKILPPVKKGVPYKKIGPLSEEEYIMKKKELGLDEQKMKHMNILKNRILWLW